MIRSISDILVTMGESPELMLVLKSTIAISLGLLLIAVARHARASVRHLVLLAAFVSLIALPLAMLLAPPINLQIERPATMAATPNPDTKPEAIVANTSNGQATASVSSAHASSLSLRSLLVTGWAIGATIFFASFALGLWKLSRLRRTSLPLLEARETLEHLARSAGIRRRVDILIHHELAVPVTCGVVRPSILVPADARTWSSEDLQRVLVHELEHVQRFDWLAHIVTRAILSFYWFHPMVWAAWRRISLEAERACDDAVVMKMERSDYAEQLVVFARRLSNALPPPLLSMANRSDLSKRVSSILSTNQLRGRVGGVVTVTVLAISIGLALGIAPVRAINAPPPQSQKIQKTVSVQQRAINVALLETAEAGETEDLIRLLDAGADVNASVSGDGSPLIVAAKSGHIKVVQLLLDRGADPNMGVEGDGNPLIAASTAGHADVARLLLDRGASIDLVVPGDENALIQASGEGHINVVKLLISKGADVNARVWVDEGVRKAEWRTPLSQARKSSHSEIVKLLLAAGARE